MPPFFHHEGFLKDICTHPQDDAVRLIYADWLQDNGHPLYGEFIRTQIALFKSPRNIPYLENPLSLDCKRDNLVDVTVGTAAGKIPPIVRLDYQFTKMHPASATISLLKALVLFKKPALSRPLHSPITHITLKLLALTEQEIEQEATYQNLLKKEKELLNSHLNDYLKPPDSFPFAYLLLPVRGFLETVVVSAGQCNRYLTKAQALLPIQKVILTSDIARSSHSPKYDLWMDKNTRKHYSRTFKNAEIIFEESWIRHLSNKEISLLSHVLEEWNRKASLQEELSMGELRVLMDVVPAGGNSLLPTNWNYPGRFYLAPT